MSEVGGGVSITDENIHKFYVGEDPTISAQCREILTQYSGIAENELIAHVRRVRERAWNTHRYPCIGRYAFLDFSIGSHSFYPTLLEEVKKGATLLDLGCCVGQDLRKLVFDGAPPGNLTGSELEPAFIDLGYDLFRDQDRLHVSFKLGDFFAPGTAGLQDGSYDYIHAGSFFHLFDWEGQFAAIAKCVRLLKQKPGSMIFGRQAGTRSPGAVDHAHAHYSSAYRHDEASFARLIAEVAEKTGVPLEVQSVSVEEQRIPGPAMPGITMWMRQRFCITIKDAA